MGGDGRDPYRGLARDQISQDLERVLEGIGFKGDFKDFKMSFRDPKFRDLWMLKKGDPKYIDKSLLVPGYFSECVGDQVIPYVLRDGSDNIENQTYFIIGAETGEENGISNLCLVDDIDDKRYLDEYFFD